MKGFNHYVFHFLLTGLCILWTGNHHSRTVSRPGVPGGSHAFKEQYPRNVSTASIFPVFPAGPDLNGPSPLREFVLPGSGEDDGQNLAAYFQCFSPLDDDFSYTITLCADIPDDHDPDRVRVKDEPGHTFLILEKSGRLRKGQAVIKVFGFYPQRPASCLIFKNVRSLIMDNSEREYDASLSAQITPGEFAMIIRRSQELARRKYNLNEFNCYDYVIEVFNSLPGIEKLPLTHVKFPFLLGSGGSPCGLYRDLQRLKKQGSPWAPGIHFGTFYAPCSNPE